MDKKLDARQDKSGKADRSEKGGRGMKDEVNSGGKSGRNGKANSGGKNGMNGKVNSGGKSGMKGKVNSGGKNGMKGKENRAGVKPSRIDGSQWGKKAETLSGEQPGRKASPVSENRSGRKNDWTGEKEKRGKAVSARAERAGGKSDRTQPFEPKTRLVARKPQRDGKRSRLCPVARQCGGCQMLDVAYSQQLKIKQKKVEELLKGLCPVNPIIGMADPFHYRNKVHAVFDRDKKGNIISGIYQENTHDVVPVDRCMIEDEKADEIIGTIRGMLKSFKIRIYDEDTGYGLLRHVLIRRGFTTDEIMVVLVTASPIFPSKNNFVKALREKHPEITTIIQNINGRGTSMVLGDKEHVLYGKGYIVDELCGCRFRISSKSFYQINPVQTEILYEKALELAGLTGREVVVDAYCGIGTIGIIASKKAGQVIGVELNRDAVKDAVNNAKMNEIQNIRFYCNDAGRFLINMAEQGEKADIVIMDPPRSGSTEEFMDSIGKLGAKKVVYVSCNPETLARDVRYMKKLGYRAKEAWVVDMFPLTNHVETICRLVRIK